MGSSQHQPTSLLRTPNGLVVWHGVVDRTLAEGHAAEVEADAVYVLGCRTDSALAAVLAAHGRLASVAIIDASVAQDVALVLRETIADPRCDPPSLPSLEVEPPPPAYQPTAANPRAYRGTKDRPPKPRQPEPVDLRLFLLSAAGVERLARKLVEVAPGFVAPSEVWNAPASLRIACGPHVRQGADPGDLGALVTLWHQLDGDSVTGLRSRLARFACNGKLPSALTLLRATLAVPARLREAVSRGLSIEAETESLDEEIIGAAVELSGMGFTEDHEGRTQLRRWTRALTLRSPDEYGEVFGGAKLCLLTGDTVDETASGQVMPPAEVAELLMEFVCDQGSRRFGAVDLWGHASWMPVMPRLLTIISQALAESTQAKPGTFPLDVDVIGRILDMLVETADGSSWESSLGKLEDALPGFLTALTAVETARQRGAFAAFYEVYSCRVNYLARAEEAAGRWFRAPFDEESLLYQIIEPFSVLNERNWRRLVDAPDAAMLEFDRTCTTFNESYLVSMTLYSTVLLDEDWAVDQFLQRPKAFIRVLRLLALLSRPVRRELIASTMGAHGTAKPADTPLESLLEAYAQLPLPSGATPIPRALKQHLSGDRHLKPGQLERHRAGLIEAWPDSFLHALRMGVMQRVSQSLLTSNTPLTPEEIEALPDAVQHAFLFQSTLDSNRPALRRLLRAVLDGDEENLKRHPRNHAWAKEMAAATSPATLAHWQRLPSYSEELPGFGEVTITPELQPLEALRMGTYVGSCYALHGSFKYSAAAVVMDANKQVVFARSSTGTFLARQVIVISFDWKLCCYAVYAHQDEEVFEGLFRRYNEHLNRVLAMPLATDDDGGVALLVSSESYNDGVWVPDREDRPKKRKASR